ncbi:MAG TPA: peptide chain release factor-like protein [Acidobacteriota bacterium]
MRIDLEALERDCEMTFLVAGGPGGQHRNRSATGVRLKHLPTGLVVTATERRSQIANRRAAFERLRAKLEARLRKPKPRVATKPSKAARRKRLEFKRRQSQAKQLRRKVDSAE